MSLAKVAYGVAFVMILPALLIAWAAAAGPNVPLPAYGSAWLGLSFAAIGIGMIAKAMSDLWHFGGGLPMNAFPPPKFVKQGAFQILPHPIYTGFVLTCLGISMGVQSAAGLWLVTPSAAAGCAALVVGYERLDLIRRFGNTIRLLPADDETRPSLLERARCFVCTVVPWVALYEVTIRIPAHGISFGLAFEDRLSIWPWTAPVYQSIYAVVAAAPWCARTRRDLRRLTISSWLASAIVFPFYWVVPSSAPRRPMTGDSWVVPVLHFERTTYPPVAAFPSFHVLWAVFVARLFRRRWVGWTYVAAISISCVTTGMHYTADLVASLALAPGFLFPGRGWALLRTGSERLANSWREWRIGHVRILNLAAYGGIASFLQVAIVMAAAGPARKWQVLATALAGLAGAAIWAQWIEGSSRLRRPFGFYGGLIGVGLCCLCFPDRWMLLGAHCLAAPWMQAVGRLRCLVNGCCHGAPSSADVGITVTAPQSRVTRLAHLGGIPIHPTQVYSILSNVFLGVLLFRLWISGSPVSLVCGVYALGNGFARFAEEGYRGEPQTEMVWGLRFYQWMAAVSVITGAVVTTMPSPAARSLTPGGWTAALAFGVLAGAALGIDFPDSDRPFTRLA